MPVTSESAHRLNRIAAASALVFSIQVAMAQTMAFSLPALPLDQALAQFARQAGLQLTASPDLLTGLRGGAVRGTLDVKAALAELLRGSGLEGRVADGLLTIERASPTNKTEASLPEVRVTAGVERETATGPVPGYVARRSATATKTDTPLVDTPQSISVVGREQMTAQAVQTTEQALRYTAGVLTEVTGYDLRYQSLIVRGFAPTIYRDGLRTFASGSYGDWQSDPQGLERVEVLKGPASVLYGQGSPGGLVNQVAKRPGIDPVNEVGLSAGNHDRYQATLDVGGQLDPEGRLLFRINGLARDSKTQTDRSRDNRLYIAPALTWLASAQTTLTVLADVTEDRVTPKSWWPNQALLVADPRIPVSRFAGEPGFDHYNRDMASVAYLLEHRLDEVWTLRQNLRYSHFKLDYQHVYGDEWTDDTHRSITRGTLVSRTQGHAITLDNQIESRLNLAGIDHQLLAGVDLQRFSGAEDLGFGSAPDLAVYKPVYGLPLDPVQTTRSNSRLRQFGVYAQDQMRWGAWILNLGLRHDRAKSSYSDADGFASDAQDSKTTHSIGLLHTFGNGVAPYLSYSSSFEPASLFSRRYDGTDLGGQLQPETGRQFEVGVKYQPPNSNSVFTASVFDLRKQNVTTDDPDHRGYSLQTGEARSRGLELEATVSLSRQLDLISSYTHLDPEVTRGAADELGKQPVQTARHTAKAWLDFHFADEALRGWGVGAGVRYVGKVAADPANTYFNPAYTLFDATVHYKSGPLTLALNAANLFDKVYVANRAQFYGQGRTIAATATYRW